MRGVYTSSRRHALRSKTLQLPSEEGQSGAVSGGGVWLHSCRRSPPDTAPPGPRFAAGAGEAD